MIFIIFAFRLVIEIMNVQLRHILKMASYATLCSLISIEGNALPCNSPAEEKDWGVVRVSVCNLRNSNDYDAGMATQALLGMPVKIVRRDDWFQVLTPDNYTAWVHPRSVQPMTREELSAWNKARQVVVTSLYAMVYEQPKMNDKTVSDVVAGDRLQLVRKVKNYFEVRYPDGRTGFLRKSDGEERGYWRKHLKNDVKSILHTAFRLNGLPYMWGGTSTKGVDCSGFVCTTLLQHDIMVPRNASQQALKGQHIDIAPDFTNLQPGDFLFFGTKAEGDSAAKVSHVGLYIGNKRFIHSLGWVHVSSFNPDDAEYDDYDLKRLLWAQRILPYINKEDGLLTTDRCPMYQ